MTGARTEQESLDAAFMVEALQLARRGLGNVWPNPSVGAIIVSNRAVVGRGWTQRGGRPHAETEALRHAGDAAKGATAYVTLEPCAHYGQTPPCASAMIDAGITRAVIALEDPDPRVSGRGIEILKNAGVDVAVGCEAAKAQEINQGFLNRVTLGRPLFTLKMASTLDGRIATHTGDSRWITDAPARAEAHRLRAEHDAVLVGSGTLMTDDPHLDCRLPGMSDCSPVRVVVDRRLRVDPSCHIIRTAREIPTWVVTASGAGSGTQHQLTEAGVTVITVEPDDAGVVSAAAVARALGAAGLTRVLIEGGGQIAAAFLSAGLVDQVAWFHAPVLIGADGLPAVGVMGIDRIKDAIRLRAAGTRRIGPDWFGLYKKHE
ncbi:MAG: bifunctional diaminohydroxyphosphoribosylaminopyrimidine deaminase/5-amino-6-(5-phosphoribosylamino)uracil reductase RibD [Hyphomicrobiales bacterium]|nr:bifunctional diaminohydroxyphosphoribosylaminopyrimidine deaminase/5-amino-6-(5-phosphoribosylamino)uracil reductase RibD [Hyphomicrobiales bacterium]